MGTRINLQTVAPGLLASAHIDWMYVRRLLTARVPCPVCGAPTVLVTDVGVACSARCARTKARKAAQNAR